MKNRSSMTVITCLCLAIAALGGGAAGQEFVLPSDIPELALPIMVTTCGQAPGAMMFALNCELIGLSCTLSDVLTTEEFVAACSGDAPVRVLVVTTGTSLKGMGAAGVDVDSEIKRCLALIVKARELGVTVIVAQIEGPSRRSDESDEKSIRAMTPEADLLITRSDVNNDGYFTRIAEEKGIPQIFIEKTLDLQRLLPILFGMN